MRCALALVLGLVCCACAEEQPARDHGLLAVTLELEPERLGDLFASTGSGAYLDARVTLGGERFAAEVRAAGGYSLHYPKRSLNVRLTRGTFRGVRDYRLSATEADRAMVRTPLAYEVFGRFGLVAPEVTPVSVTVNGRFWGLYFLIERMTAEFFARRGRPCVSRYEATGYARFVPGTAAHIEHYFDAHHEPEHFNEIRRLAELVETASDAAFAAEIFAHLDRASAVHYMAAATVTAHVDGFDKNLTYWAPRLGAPLRLAPWDMDKAWYLPFVRSARPGDAAWRDNRLFVRLWAMSAVRAEVGGLVEAALRGEDGPEAFAARVLAASDEIALAYADDMALAAGRGLSREAEAAALIEGYAVWAENVLAGRR